VWLLGLAFWLGRFSTNYLIPTWQMLATGCKSNFWVSSGDPFKTIQTRKLVVETKLRHFTIYKLKKLVPRAKLRGME